MRAFLGIELPEPAREVAAALQHHLKTAPARVAWVRPENFHITLRFLGEVSEEQVELCVASLARALPCQRAPHLCISGVGSFPSVRRPAVLWAGVNVLQGELREIFLCCEAAACAAGIPPETREFHPHVTLGRVRDPGRCPHLSEVFQQCATRESNAFAAASVALFESKMHAGGSVYRLVHRFPLRQ